MFSRAAISGGVNPYRVYEISDLYLQEISRTGNSKDYSQIITEARRVFSAEVRNAKTATTESLPVEKCKQYIALNLNTHIQLPDIAEYVGVTPSYLSCLFREKEKISVREYILKERIRAAKNMLRFSDYTISQISDYLRFFSQSHFGSVFRKLTGETPGEYRKKHLSTKW